MFGLMIAAVAAAAIPMAIPGPHGDLAGTFVGAGKGAPVVLIIPGSGPTDRDGNNAMGVTAAPYRLLADALATKGVSTLRADKRGMFGSKTAIPDPNAVSIADYAADAHNWAKALRKRTGARCVWLLGHSEGGLIALAAAQQPQDLCGLILVAAPGRKLGTLLREQLQANPANAPLLPQAMAALDSLEAGKHGRRFRDAAAADGAVPAGGAAVPDRPAAAGSGRARRRDQTADADRPGRQGHPGLARRRRLARIRRDRMRSCSLRRI